MAHAIYIIRIELIGIGYLTAEIERILSPITTERLIKKIPYSSSGRFFIGGKDFFTIPVGIKRGEEKAVKDVEKGDLVYDPSSDSLMICLKTGKSRMKINRLGKITSGLEHFEKVQRSNGVKISMIK
ncbi:MAG: cyclophilin-like fold protein [Promethearchaeota archaeon]